MKKQILISIVTPDIITNPPQGDVVNINIDGLEAAEVILILSSVLGQISSKELPKIIQAIKNSKVSPYST